MKLNVHSSFLFLSLRAMEKRLYHQLQGFIDTPPLWNSKFKGIEQFALPKIVFPKEVDIISQLPSLASNFVLGKRMERFFELIIHESSRYQLLSKNVQISREKITLGELDFLLKDLQKNKFIHLELVFKFYVYDPSFSEEAERWIGPNRRDSFLQKLEKLKQKQFPLLYRPETREYLQTLKLSPENLQQRSCFKAKLFLPKQYQEKNLSLINKKCISGYWLHFKEFNTAEYKDNLYKLPSKQDWPVAPEMGENWLSFSDTLEEIQKAFQKRKSPLLWMKKSENEYERFFVVWW